MAKSSEREANEEDLPAVAFNLPRWLLGFLPPRPSMLPSLSTLTFLAPRRGPRWFADGASTSRLPPLADRLVCP